MSNERTGLRGLFLKVFVDRTDSFMPQLMRYLWVGLTTTIIDLIVLNGLLMLDSPVWLAASVGYMVGVVANYFLCIRWIFASDPSRRAWEFLGSMIVGLVGLLLNTGIVVAGEKMLPRSDLFLSLLDLLGIPPTQIVHVNTAKGVSVVTVLAWNFLARKYFIFRRSE